MDNWIDGRSEYVVWKKDLSEEEVRKRYFEMTGREPNLIHSRGNVGVTGLASDYNFCEVGAKIGPKTLWDKLCEVDGGWEFYKDDYTYTFENKHIDRNGNSWGRSEIVLTYMGYRTVYDDLKEWLKEGKKFVIYYDSDYDDPDTPDIPEDPIGRRKTMSVVEDLILFNIPEEVYNIVIQGISAEVEGELICNNPYASPEYSVDWRFDEKEFTITIQSPNQTYTGYLPCDIEITIEKAD